MGKRFCYWSVGTGSYSFMLQACVGSFRAAGVEADFIALSDRDIVGATKSIRVPNYKTDKCFFKPKLLQEVMSKEPYDYFIYVDSDVYCVADPPNIVERMGAAPVFAVMQEEITRPVLASRTWYGWPLAKIVGLMKEMGVKSKIIYNTNGGLFAVYRHSISTFVQHMTDFRRRGEEQGYARMPDEPAIVFAVQKMVSDLDCMMMHNNTDLWGCDGKLFKDSLPTYSEWEWPQHFTTDRLKVKPALVHMLRGKNLMRMIGEDIVANGTMM